MSLFGIGHHMSSLVPLKWADLGAAKQIRFVRRSLGSALMMYVQAALFQAVRAGCRCSQVPDGFLLTVRSPEWQC